MPLCVCICMFRYMHMDIHMRTHVSISSGSVNVLTALSVFIARYKENLIILLMTPTICQS